MLENTKNTGQTSDEFAIDILLSKFHSSLDSVVSGKISKVDMEGALHQFNPMYKHIEIETFSQKAEILAQVVAAIYAPLFHSFSTTVLKNIKSGSLTDNIIAPPRDAIPMAVSLKSCAEILRTDVNILMPYINRNTAGIFNNQKSVMSIPDPLLSEYFDQEKSKMKGTQHLCEIETGIYGTTSYVMAHEFKQRGVKTYTPLKLYGLGPNLSYVHAILSGGQEWVAENAELNNLVDLNKVKNFMVILDSMEELGMEKHYKSVERLVLNDEKIIIPEIVPVSDEEKEIARVTNLAIYQTAGLYINSGSTIAFDIINNVQTLIDLSKEGYPLTLTEAIPSMDSKDEHFDKIRLTKPFDYPKLQI